MDKVLHKEVISTESMDACKDMPLNNIESKLMPDIKDTTNVVDNNKSVDPDTSSNNDTITLAENSHEHIIETLEKLESPKEHHFESFENTKTELDPDIAIVNVETKIVTDLTTNRIDENEKNDNATTVREESVIETSKLHDSCQILCRDSSNKESLENTSVQICVVSETSHSKGSKDSE